MPSRDRRRRRPLRPARPARSTRERSAGLLPGFPQTGGTRSGTAVVGWVRTTRRPRPAAPVLSVRFPYAPSDHPASAFGLLRPLFRAFSRPTPPTQPLTQTPTRTQTQTPPPTTPARRSPSSPNRYTCSTVSRAPRSPDASRTPSRTVTATAPASPSDLSPSSRTRGCPAANCRAQYARTASRPCSDRRPACSASPRPGPDNAVRRRPARPSRRRRTSAAAMPLAPPAPPAAILSCPPPTSPRPRPAWNR